MKRSPFFILIAFSLLSSFQPQASFAQDEPDATVLKVVSKTVPAYLQVARAMSLSGAVKLEVLVQPNGNIKSVQVKGGNPVLVQSAQTAIQGWKWRKPTTSPRNEWNPTSTRKL
jgi:TonB family protein